MKLHNNIYLTTDILFVSQIPFFVTLSRKIVFTATTHLQNRKIDTVYKAFLKIYTFYRRGGSRITTVSCDGEFAPLARKLSSDPEALKINLTVAVKIQIHKSYNHKQMHSSRMMKQQLLLFTERSFQT